MDYLIKRGDTLGAIAKANGVGVRDILAANPHITNPDLIYAGTSLKLPVLGRPAAPTTTPAAAPVPGVPAAPAGPDYSAAAKTAGQAGLAVKDYASFLGPTADEHKAEQDRLAKQFGYADYDTFTKDVFQKPSQTTEQYYRDAFSAAGLDEILTNISSKKAKLAEALNTVNDNPWYDESFRRGEASRLQLLANGDIQSLLDEYNLRHGKVKELVGAHATDLGEDAKLREARFRYLEDALKDSGASLSNDRALKYLTDYTSGKQGTEKPQTISVGEGQALYQWNPTSKTFENVITRPKTYAPKKGGSGSGGGGGTAGEKKIVAAFNKAVANRAALNRAKTREQFIRELQAQYPQIDPTDIARKVYETYPDHYDGK